MCNHLNIKLYFFFPSIAGWEPQNTALTHSLHIGDRLTMVNQQLISSANFAQETMKLTTEDEVYMEVK